MKNLIILLFLAIQVQVWANMASPVIRGTLGSRPFVSQYVDVTHEELLIQINEGYKSAAFHVKYHIHSSKDGLKIPFLFYASEYLDSFRVSIDGKEVYVQDIPYDFDISEKTKFKDFSYFFEDSSSNYVVVDESPSGGFYVNLDDMIYFETDISKGKHTIEVTYQATPWINRGDWLKEYSFRYALSPAKYWKSFGTLDITIDASRFDADIIPNLGVPTSGSIDSIAHWKFDRLPKDILTINYTPKVSPTSQTLIKIQPSGLALITGIILALLHLFLVIWYRKRNLSKRFSLVVIIGSLLVPLIYLISMVGYYDVIDSVIGEHAGGRHGYTFLVIILYPIIFLVYWLVYWLIDRFVKRKYTRTHA